MYTMSGPLPPQLDLLKPWNPAVVSVGVATPLPITIALLQSSPGITVVVVVVGPVVVVVVGGVVVVVVVGVVVVVVVGGVVVVVVVIVVVVVVGVVVVVVGAVVVVVVGPVVVVVEEVVVVVSMTGGVMSAVQDPNSTSPYLIRKKPLSPQPAPQLFFAVQDWSASLQPTIRTK